MKPDHHCPVGCEFISQEICLKGYDGNGTCPVGYFEGNKIMSEHERQIQDMADIKAWRKVTEPALRELATDSKEILKQLADINAKIANHQACPAPSKCNELEIRVRTLEDSKQGATSVGRVVLYACGALMTGLVGSAAGIEIIRFFSNKSLP